MLVVTQTLFKLCAYIFSYEISEKSVLVSGTVRAITNIAYVNTGLKDLHTGTSLQSVWAIFRSNQWSTTGLSKAVVCTVLSMEKCI